MWVLKKKEPDFITSLQNRAKDQLNTERLNNISPIKNILMPGVPPQQQDKFIKSNISEIEKKIDESELKQELPYMRQEMDKRTLEGLEKVRASGQYPSDYNIEADIEDLKQNLRPIPYGAMIETDNDRQRMETQSTIQNLTPREQEDIRKGVSIPEYAGFLGKTAISATTPIFSATSHLWSKVYKNAKESGLTRPLYNAVADVLQLDAKLSNTILEKSIEGLRSIPGFLPFEKSFIDTVDRARQNYETQIEQNKITPDDVEPYIDGLMEIAGSLYTYKGLMKHGGKLISKLTKGFGLESNVAEKIFNDVRSIDATPYQKSKKFIEEATKITPKDKQFFKWYDSKIAQSVGNTIEKGGEKIQKFFNPLDEIRFSMSKFGDEILGGKIFEPLEKGYINLSKRNPYLNALNRSLIYGYNKPEQWILERNKMYGRIYLEKIKIKEIAQLAGKNLTSLERRDLGYALRGLKPISKKLEPIYKEFRSSIDDYSQKMIDSGLINDDMKETFKANIGKYIATTYSPYEMKKIENFIASQSILGGSSLKKELQGKGSLAPGLLEGLRQKKDIPQDVKDYIGEIIEPGLPYLKRTPQLSKALNIHDFQTFTLENGLKNGYVFDDISHLIKNGKTIATGSLPSLAKKSMIHGGEILSTEQLLTKKYGKNFRMFFEKIPNDEKYGILANKWIQKEVVQDLFSINEFSKPSALNKLWNVGRSMWKIGKIMQNPASMARDMYSGIISMNMAGMPAYRFADRFVLGAKSLLMKDKYWKRYAELGGFKTTAGETELKPFLDLLNSDKSGPNDINKILSAITESAKKATKLMPDLYIGLDKARQLSMFRYLKEVGNYTDDAAFKLTQQSAFTSNENVPGAIAFVANTFHPFFQFTAKAGKHLWNSLTRHPIRTLKWYAMFKLWNEYARNRVDKEMKEKGLSPLYDQGEGEGKVGLPPDVLKRLLDERQNRWKSSFNLLWHKLDAYNHPQMLQTSYWIPTGMINDMIDDFHRLLIPSDPRWTTMAALANQKLYNLNPDDTGRSQITTRRKGEEIEAYKSRKRMGILHELKNIWSPTFFGGYSVDKFIAAVNKKKDYAGRLRTMNAVLQDTLIGWKFFPLTSYNQDEVDKLLNAGETLQNLYENKENLTPVQKQMEIDKQINNIKYFPVRQLQYIKSGLLKDKIQEYKLQGFSDKDSKEQAELDLYHLRKMFQNKLGIDLNIVE